ncbi:MAG: hypothetical protein V1685_06520 [Parcubacteria group bacterium]
MTLQLRRTFLIVGFIIVVIVIGVLIYFLFFRGFITPTNNENVNGVNGGLPLSNDAVNRITINELLNRLPPVNGVNGGNTNRPVEPDRVARGGATVAPIVVQDTTQGLAVDRDGSSLVYYDPITDKFYRINRDGTKTELSGNAFPEVSEIVWAPDRSSAILTFPDGSKILYNFDTNTQVTLPKEWDDVTFSPDGGQVAYKYMAEDADARWLAISNPDGSEVRGIEHIGDKGDDVEVAWSPNNQMVALFHESSGISSEEVLPIGFNGENFQSFSVNGRGFQGAWAPAGDRVVYSTYSSDSNFNPTLNIVDVYGQNIGSNHQTLGLQTWPDKCAFGGGGATLYCAVPSSLPEGSGIYRELANNVPDIFYKIDLLTGQQTRIALPVNELGSGGYSAKNMFLSQDEQYLYFTDTLTGRVHKMQIK